VSQLNCNFFAAVSSFLNLKFNSCHENDQRKNRFQGALTKAGLGGGVEKWSQIKLQKYWKWQSLLENHKLQS